MIEAVRRLVQMMQEEGMSYPLHLGVTEAGEGEDGRVRSAAGIGALLAEGIGDTIRVSLTEDPEKEIPVAKKLVEFLPRGVGEMRDYDIPAFKTKPEYPAPFRRVNGPLVMLNMNRYKKLDSNAFRDAGFTVDDSTGSVTGGDNAADLILASHCPENIPSSAAVAVPYQIWMQNRGRENLYPVFSPETWPEANTFSPVLNVVLTDSHTKTESLKKIDAGKTLLVFTYRVSENKFAPDGFLRALSRDNLYFGIILNPVFDGSSIEDLYIVAPAILGGYLNDRAVSGISISCHGDIPVADLNRLCFSILQCTGVRITRTVYISCPTCGRTKFNLQEALAKVKEKTSHLKGLKIAVMGCIVNGPGEMAGADWGYVGAGRCKVHIYKGSEPVLKNIGEEKAIDELLRLIEEDQASR
jgi:(E)-4-hydroxy-3-methylbut-2-enyl-diphosphate synthase